MRSSLRKLSRLLLSALMVLVSLSAPGFIAPANALGCSAVGSNVSMTALHRASGSGWGAANYTPFYADVQGGVSGKTSAYVGYSIDGSLVSGVSDLWIKLSGFSANLGLASNQSASIPVRDKFKNAGGADDATKRVAYFYLTTSYSGNDTTTDQTFNIQLFNGNPNIGGTELCNDSDGFSGIIDTISANANKVTSVSTTATTATLGSDFEVTALGQTGTMGAGDSSDRVGGYGPFVISPSITNTWNADAFNLVGVSYVIDSNNNGFLTDDTVNYNGLRYYPTFTSNRPYKVVYYFAARKVASSTLFQPVQNIASGNNVKYTGTYSGTATNTSISIVKGSLSLNKALLNVSTSVGASNTTIDVSYRLTIKNSSSVTSLFDYVQDQVTLNSGTTGGAFVSPTNGATLTLDGTSSITPTTKAAISGSILTLNFNGPITLTSGQTSNIDYTVRVTYPNANASMPISNTATGYVGAETVTSSTGVNAVNVDIKLQRTLRIDYSSSGYVTVDAKQIDGSACSSSGLGSGSITCTFYKGTALTLTAVSASSAISSWGSTANGHASNTGNCATSNANSPCTLIIQENSIITPTFNTSYTVTINGVSNVSVSDGGVAYSCSAGTCTKTYADGSTPSLTFTPNTGYTISSITSNAVSPTTATFPDTSSGSLLVKSNITITVSASLPQYGLDVSASAGGSVSSGGGYIATCSSDAAGATGTCGALINSGTSVTLTATVSASYYFGGWSGDSSCSGTSLTCTFVMNQNRNVIATFTSSPSLVVTVVGTGSVSAGSGAISGCDSTGVNCSGSYTLNSSVTLTATIPSGYSVAWSGACSGSNSTCSVTMNSSKAVTATFTINSYSITINSATGGSASSSDATVTSGGSATLTAVASSGYTFTSWSCTGGGTLSSTTTNPTTLSNITANATCTPTFTINTYTVTVTPTTTGGSVSGSVGAISSCTNSSGTCASTHDYGTVVTLTATPSSGYVINSWTGACSGNSATCVVTMTSAKTVGISYTATYTITIGTLTNAGTSTIGIATSPSVAGATITLTISPEAGKQLKSGTLKALYSGATEATISGLFTFTMPSANVIINAEFEPLPAGSYSVTINSATGGSATTSDLTVTSGGSATLTATPSSGYVFATWNCSGGGTLSSTTTNPATLSNITANASCTPVFNVVYTVTFNSNGASGTASSATLTQASSGAAITLASAGTMSLSNSGFTGWSVDPSSGTILKAGNSYTPPSSITLYAQWVTTTAATSVGSITATLNGTATSALSPVSFCYGTDSALSGCTTVSASGSYTANVTGLTASTLYYFRILGTANSTSYNGGILSFTTSALTAWSITASNANYTIGGTVPTLTGTASPSGGLSGSLTCNAYDTTDTGFNTPKTIDASLPAGTYVIRCTGSSAAGYATPTYTNATLTVSASSPTTYTITASAGSNGSISPSGAVTVTSGNNQSFTITANSGYQINVLTVDSSTVTTASTYTFTNVTADHTISVTFTATSGGRGNSGITPAITNNKNVKIIVQKVSVGPANNSGQGQTTTSTTTSGGTTTTTTTSPGTTTSSGTTTTTTQSGTSTTTTTTTTPGTSSQASATGVTASSGGLLNALTNTTESAKPNNNGAVVEAVNTTVSTALVIDKNVPASVAVERTADNKISVQGINGWTGRVSVAVVDENNPSAVESFVEVAINPLPVTKVVVNNANTVKEQKIAFDPSPSEVVKYQVVVNNKVVCESATTSCALPKLVGPKSKVEIVAIGNDETRSIPTPIKVVPTKPIVALVVNFPVGSSALSPKYRADLRALAKVLIREGFTRIQIDGHTDTQGNTIGYDNQVLSDARSRATKAYLQKLVPGLTFATSANSYLEPAADNVTPEGQFTNRRAEVKVW